MFTKPSRAIAAWTRADLLACLACAALGLVLAVEPHLANWAAEGSLDYIQDGDDLLYLAISRVPFHGEWSLRDPFATPDEHVPTLYAWLQFVPLAKLARLLGLSSVTTSLLWRAVGGPLLGVGVFSLFRELLGGLRRPTAWALGCAVVCLCDRGFAEGRPLIQDLGLLLEMVRPSGPLTGGNRLPLYRVVTPILNLPWLLLLAAVLVPGGRRGRPGLGGGGDLPRALLPPLFLLLDGGPGRDRGLPGRPRPGVAARPRRGAGRAEGGAEVRGGGAGRRDGPRAPQVVQQFADLRRPAVPARPRADGPGPAARAGQPEADAHLANRLVLAELAVGGAVIAGLGLWNLGLPWCLTLAGYLLSTSAAVTGLEFENFHWGYVYAAFGEILILSLVATVLDGLGPSRWKRALWAYPAALAPDRPGVAGLRAAESSIRPRRQPDPPRARPPPRRPGGAPPRRVAGRAPGGEPRGAPDAGGPALRIRPDLDQLAGPERRGRPPIRPERLAHRHGHADVPRGGRDAEPTVRYGVRDEWIADFRAVLDGGADELLRRYRVGALLVPAGGPEPVRGGPWRREAVATDWTLWRRAPAPSTGGATR